MKRQICLAALVCGLSATMASAEDAATAADTTGEAAGVVRLSSLGPVVRGQSEDLPGTEVPESVVDGGVWPAGHFHAADGCTDGSCGDCQDGACGHGGCNDGSCGHGGRTHHLSGWMKGQSDLYRDRNRRNSGMFANYMRGKFGYFCPTGNGGKGVPLFGKYHMVYAQNPGHTDARDGYGFQAPGYGTHVNVPLAPNVRHTYNYGWGMPSSRLTSLRQATVVGPPQDVVHGPRW